MTIQTSNGLIKLAKQAGFNLEFDDYVYEHWDNFQAFAKLVAERERKFYMQLFLDPENQPTQFGTAIEEYRDAEKADLLKRLEIAKKVWHEDQQRISEIAAKEREACAKLCEDFADVDSGPDGIMQDYHAYLIRARGTTE